MKILGPSPIAGKVSTAAIDDDAITTAKIAANNIDGTLTKDSIIGDFSDVTITASDLIVYGDATDSNNSKRDTVQGILDLAASDVEFVSSTSASGASSVSFESLASGYNYHVSAEGVFLPSGTVIEVTIGTGSTSYQTSGYLGASDGAASNGDGADVTTGTSGMQLNASGYGAWADAAVGAGAINLTVFNVGATATVKPIQCHWCCEVATDGTWYQGYNSSAYGTVGAITAVKFTVSGGTITGQFFLHRTKLS